MGDPRKLRKKYSTPAHPWQGQRIQEEHVLLKKYGLKNKKEVWKSRSILKNVTSQAKKLAGSRNQQAAKERELLLQRLQKLGLLKAGAGIGDVLNIPFEDVLNRRLQTVVHRQGLARSVRQARQFVTHGHITVGGKLVDVPSYLVTVEEQGMIGFKEHSSLADFSHPERVEIKKAMIQEPEEAAVLEQKEQQEAQTAEVKAEAEKDSSLEKKSLQKKKKPAEKKAKNEKPQKVKENDGATKE